MPPLNFIKFFEFLAHFNINNLLLVYYIVYEKILDMVIFGAGSRLYIY